MTLLHGTKADEILDRWLNVLLEAWSKRGDQRLLQDWTGFGVSVDEPEKPKIVLFFSSATAPDLNAIFGHNAILGYGGSASDKYRIVLNAEFRAVPPRPIRRKSSDNREFAPAAHPGDEVFASSICGNVNEGGTIGAFLIEPENPNVKWILSANHAIAFNNQYSDTKIVAPGTGLTLTNPTPVLIVQGAPSQVDAAIALATPLAASSPRIPGLPLTSIEPPQSFYPNLAVAKVGFGMPLPTTGNVKYLAARIQVNLPQEDLGSPICEFANQWLIQGNGGPFSASGDSGALVVAQPEPGTSLPFALLIATQFADGAATDDLLSVATPFKTILSELCIATGKTLILDPKSVGIASRSQQA